MATNRYTIVFKKPSILKTESLTRREKYELLKQHSTEVRTHLEAWLNKKNLSNHVKKIEPETAFNVLFVEATDDIGKALKEFPEAIKVGQNEGLQIEALGVK